MVATNNKEGSNSRDFMGSRCNNNKDFMGSRAAINNNRAMVVDISNLWEDKDKRICLCDWVK
jgi:hypothetical protein